MNSNLSFRISLFYILAITGIATWFYTGGSIVAFFSILLFCWLMTLIGSIGFHRWLAHKSFEPTNHGKIIMMFGMLIESFGRPLISATVHRAHHSYPDQHGDPHSPKFLSFFDMLIGKYSDLKTLPPVRDILRQEDVMWFDKHYWKIWVVFNSILAMIDWRLVLLVCPIAFCKSWFMGQHVNYFAHSGKQCIPKNGNAMLVLFSGGEHLHANHHQQPSNWRFDRDGSTPDLSAYLITLLKLRKI